MNVNNIISEITKHLAINVSLPSTKTSIKVKPINIQQVKELIDMNSKFSYFNKGFKSQISKIILSNIIADTDVSNMVTESDVLALFALLRGKEFFKDLSIDTYVESVNQINNELFKDTLKYDNITLTLGTASIQRGAEFDDYLYNNIKVNGSGEVINEAEVGEVYFYTDIARWLRSLEINEVVYELDSMLIDTVLQLIKELPVDIATKIGSFSYKLEEHIKSKLIINDTNIPFNISFFE